jgi:hypothetical protein
MTATGPVSLLFDGPNNKQTFTAEQQGVSVTTEALVSCACGEATVTAHASAADQSQCQSKSMSTDCSKVSFWGDTSSAQSDLAVDCPDDCGGGSGECDHWQLSVPATFMRAAGKLGSALGEVNQTPLQMQDATTLDVYFKKNSDVVMGYGQDTSVQQIMMCFSTWDTNSSIDAATWSVPASWGDCPEAQLAALQI